MQSVARVGCCMRCSGINSAQMCQLLGRPLPSLGVPFCFTGFKLALIVGICGCLPHGFDGKKEILLGDVVSEALMLYSFGR
jgi:hypothetical protein